MSDEEQLSNDALETRLREQGADDRSSGGEWGMAIMAGLSGTTLALALASVVFINDTSNAPDGNIPAAIVALHAAASVLGLVFVWAAALMFPLVERRPLLLRVSAGTFVASLATLLLGLAL